MTRRFSIRGGRVVTRTGVRDVDVVIAGERIESVGPRQGRGLESVDAAGCYVLPGGVDPHTHFMGDVANATRSAAFGGTTTALCFTNPQPGEPAPDAVVRGRRHLEGQAAIDVALHAVIGEPAHLAGEDLERLHQLRVRGVKLFLAYPEQGLMATDDRLYEVLKASTRLGFTVLVHCENGYLVQALIDEHLRDGRSELIYFIRSRPPQAEDEASARTLTIAEVAGATPYLVHMSTSGGIELVRQARRHGRPVYAEVCAHHLVLDERRYRSKRAEQFMMVPPLRPKEHLEALWRAIRDGTVDTVGSDHSQVRYQPPATDDFTGLAYGLPGIELRLPLLLSEGLARKVSIERLVELACANPAKIFGLYPRKGAIAPGSDADLVLWAPQPRWRVKASDLHDGLRDTPYAGTAIKGRVRAVFLRGTQLVADGAFIGPRAAGHSLDETLRPPSSRRPS